MKANVMISHLGYSGLIPMHHADFWTSQGTKGTNGKENNRMDLFPESPCMYDDEQGGFFIFRIELPDFGTFVVHLLEGEWVTPYACWSEKYHKIESFSLSYAWLKGPWIYREIDISLEG